MSAIPTFLATGWAAPVARLERLSEQLDRRLGVEPIAFDLAEVDIDASRFPLPPDEPSAYARALHERLHKCGEPARIIGWSTGGVIALETAAFWPDSIHSLVVVNSTACFCAHDDYPHGQKPAVLRSMMSALRMLPQKAVLKEFFARAALPRAIVKDELLEHVADALAQGETVLLNGLTYLLHTDLRARISRIRQPVLILHGADDHIIPVSAAHWLCDALPDGRIIEEPEKGHDIPLTDPDLLARHIEAFVQGTGART